LKVGSIYNYSEESGNTLACGSGYYPYAVCVSDKPFVLVSEAGDMLWQATIDKEKDDFVEVDIKIDTFKAFKRFHGENYHCIIIEEEW